MLLPLFKHLSGAKLRRGLGLWLCSTLNFQSWQTSVSQTCVFYRVCLQRSRSAFSLTSDDSPEKGPEEEGAGAGGGLQDYTSLKREGKATSLPSWKSVDRLDNSSKNHTDRLYSMSFGSLILTLIPLDPCTDSDVIAATETFPSLDVMHNRHHCVLFKFTEFNVNDCNVCPYK